MQQPTDSFLNAVIPGRYASVKSLMVSQKSQLSSTALARGRVWHVLRMRCHQRRHRTWSVCSGTLIYQRVAG